MIYRLDMVIFQFAMLVLPEGKSTIFDWLVVWNIFYFSIYIYIYINIYLLRIIIPTDYIIFFKGVGSPHQPDNLWWFSIHFFHGSHQFIPTLLTVNPQVFPASASKRSRGVSYGPKKIASPGKDHLPVANFASMLCNQLGPFFVAIGHG